MIIWSNSDVNSSSAWTPKVLHTFDDVVMAKDGDYFQARLSRLNAKLRFGSWNFSPEQIFLAATVY